MLFREEKHTPKQFAPFFTRFQQRIEPRKKEVFIKFLNKPMKTDKRSSYKDLILNSFTGDELNDVKMIIEKYTNEK